MSIKENIRGEAIKFVLERRAGPYKLELVQGATLESAHSQDKDNRDWQASLNHYYSVYENENAPGINRARAVTGMAQMLINTGHLNDAQTWLEKGAEKLGDVLEGRENTKFQAYSLVKLSWISGNLGKSKEQKVLLENARLHLLHADHTDFDEYDKKIFGEVEHFLGRSYFSSFKISTARKYFENSLARYEELGDLSAQGHNYLWLARCAIAYNDFDQAMQCLDKSWDLFEEDVKLRPDARDQFANALMVLGELNMNKGEIPLARHSFEQAYVIRLEHKPDYKKGKADALSAIAGTYWAEGNIGGAIKFGLEAAKTYLR